MHPSSDYCLGRRASQGPGRVVLSREPVGLARLGNGGGAQSQMSSYSAGVEAVGKRRVAGRRDSASDGNTK